MSDGFITLKSSNIDAATHKDGALIVRFKNGTTYSYADVPFGHFKRLIKARSPGAYFAGMIRGMFEATKLEEEKADDERE